MARPACYLEITPLPTPKRVLVIDDEELIARPIEHVLRKYNYDVRLATHWPDALKLIQEEKFDLITLDLQMPTINGPTMLRFIRENGVDTPVIIVSAGITERTPLDLAPFQVAAFVYKPFKVSRLKDIVEQTIGVSDPLDLEPGVALDGFLQISPHVLEPNPGGTLSDLRRAHRRRTKRKKKFFRSKEQRTQTLVAFAIIGFVSLFLSGFLSEVKRQVVGMF